MGYQTIIAINHDMLHDIEQRPDEFVDDLVRSLKGDLNGEGERIGVAAHRVATNHHTEQMTVRFNGRGFSVERGPDTETD